MLEIKKELEAKGIKPTIQRLTVYEYMVLHKNHPTVDLLYSDLSPKIPTLSKTTLYNTLNLFVDKGLAVPINIENEETRYDADITDHGHFKCRKCGKVYDFHHDLLLEKNEIPRGFRAERAHLYVWGVCAGCFPGK